MAKNDEEPKQGSENGAASKTSPTGNGVAEASPADASGKSSVAKSGQLSAATIAQPSTPTQAAPVGAAATSNKGSTQGGDAIAMLKEDHRKVEGLFAEFENANNQRKTDIIEEACRDLVIHTLLEERIFYPAARQPSTDDKLDEAQVEHDAAKVLIVELLEGDDSDDFRDAKFKVLAEQIKHHVKEEEAPDGVFAKAQKAGVNTRELAERLSGLKQQLQQRAESGSLPDPVPASFTYFGEPSQKERNMPRERDDNGRFMSDDGNRSNRSRGRDYDDDRGGSNGRERDSQGRFMSDDDDRGYRSRSRDDDDRGGSRGRGSNERERDSQGRFASDDDGGRGRSYAERGGGGGRDQGGWFGDSQGHSEASRRGWEERDGGSRGRSDRDDRDDRGYRSRGGDGERGQGGWFGDSRGHSEASRRGWDNPNHGDSGWYGDSRGHAEASRRGWDNPNHGESGWFGDSRGHSEASRRGWEDRGGDRNYSSARQEPRSYARGRDDDDDDRGGPRSGGRDQGGWSGDSEGHAEAARRGWQNRR